MFRHSLFIVLFSISSLSGQDEFLRLLAEEICECLDGQIAEPIASACLETLALGKEKDIRQRYNLEASIPVQRDLLAELLVDDLLEVCPLLQTIRPKEDQQEFRWADRRKDRAPSPPRFTAPKRPPADALTTITSEPPAVWKAAGKLLAQPGSRGLRLLTKDGKEVSFELPAAVARKRDFDPGDEISLRYRREWRPREGRIVLVVEAID